MNISVLIISIYVMVCLSKQLIEASNLIPTMVKEYSLDSSLYNEK